MEVKSNELLSRGLACDRKYSWHRWRHVFDIALQEKRRVSSENELQSTWSPFRCKLMTCLTMRLINGQIFHR